MRLINNRAHCCIVNTAVWLHYRNELIVWLQTSTPPVKTSPIAMHAAFPSSVCAVQSVKWRRNCLCQFENKTKKKKINQSCYVDKTRECGKQVSPSLNVEAGTGKLLKCSSFLKWAWEYEQWTDTVLSTLLMNGLKVRWFRIIIWVAAEVSFDGPVKHRWDVWCGRFSPL